SAAVRRGSRFFGEASTSLATTSPRAMALPSPTSKPWLCKPPFRLNCCCLTWREEENHVAQGVDRGSHDQFPADAPGEGKPHLSTSPMTKSRLPTMAGTSAMRQP